MKKEMTVLQSAHSAGEYLAPKFKVKALRQRSVLCASGEKSTITSLSNDETQGDW